MILSLLIQTAMSKPGPYLPPEIFDSIVDLLRDEPEQLNRCCLVSKSWVPCARMHLFARVKFEHPSRLEAWKETFPDPANSPAHHIRLLVVDCPEDFTVADSKEGGWPLVFPNLEQLELWSDANASRLNLVPFHNFSPILKSLHLIFKSVSLSQVFSLICSLPLLEDLSLDIIDVEISGEDDTVFWPSTSPPLTGTLTLTLFHDMDYVVRRLLDLPNGLRFRNILCKLSHGEDFEWVTALVEECSDTLEYANVGCFTTRRELCPFSFHNGTGSIFQNFVRSRIFFFSAVSLDFSKAIKLKEVMFRFNTRHTTWAVLALKTITSKHGDLQQISIFFPFNARDTIDKYTYNQWMDLDRSLVQLWDSHGIRVNIVCNVGEENREGFWEWIGALFPETKKRGIIGVHRPVQSSDAR